MNILLDPKLFNYLILILYFLSVVRWTIELNWGQVMYWSGALILTVAITFFMDK